MTDQQDMTAAEREAREAWKPPWGLHGHIQNVVWKHDHDDHEAIARESVEAVSPLLIEREQKVRAEGERDGARKERERIVEFVRRDERRRERRCEACGSKRSLPVCGEADRIVFGCRMRQVVAESWAEAIEREFGSPVAREEER